MAMYCTEQGNFLNAGSVYVAARPSIEHKLG